jgi:hypothetical protein
MKTFQDPKEKTEQIMKGLDLAYRRLIEYKKYKRSVLIVSRNGQMVSLTPEEAEAELLAADARKMATDQG